MNSSIRPDFICPQYQAWHKIARNVSPWSDVHFYTQQAYKMVNS